MNVAARLEQNQSKQVDQREKHSQERHVHLGDLVYVRDTTICSPWSAGVVLARTGEVSYQI